MDDSDPAQLAPTGSRVFNVFLRYSSVIAAIAFNVGAAWFVYARYCTVPPGSRIRDMDYGLLVQGIGALSVLAAIFFGVLLLLISKKYWREALLGLALSFLPFLTMHWILQYMMHSIGFTNDGP